MEMGMRQFYFGGLWFDASTDKVIRPYKETETIIEAVLGINERQSITDILDIGTGSGNLATVLSTKLGNKSITATDISSDAISIAKMNAKKLDKTDNISFVQMDMAGGFKEDCFDVIVCNPPYSTTEFALNHFNSGRAIGPLLSYDGGFDGFQLIYKLLNSAVRCIRSNGWIVLEVNDNQATTVVNYAKRIGNWREIRARQDLCGIDRCLALQKI